MDVKLRSKSFSLAMECDLLLDEVSLVDICLDTKNERFMMKPSN
jgi:hypothetical protein